MANSKVKLITSLGEIELEVFDDRTPVTAAGSCREWSRRGQRIL